MPKNLCAILIVIIIILVVFSKSKCSVKLPEIALPNINVPTSEFKNTVRGAGGNVMGYDQVNSPEQYAVRERTRANFINEDFDPDSRDQISAYHDVVPPSWSDDSLLYYGAVDAQVIQNHKEFTSENWMFNQNAAFSDFGDNPNYPYPVTSIRLNAINNVPTDTNPHQITEDQDDGGAARNTYTDKKICYGTV